MCGKKGNLPSGWPSGKALVFTLESSLGQLSLSFMDIEAISAWVMSSGSHADYLLESSTAPASLHAFAVSFVINTYFQLSAQLDIKILP